ncbi:MAG: T9SS type A sorting domain-containing protein [Chitinophagaceae bacterium]
MKKSYFLFVLLSFCLFACNNLREENEMEEGEENENLLERYQQEFDMVKNPTTGKVPEEKLWEAISYTKNLKESMAPYFTTESSIWTERGPYFDSVGSSNGNRRGAVASRTEGYTSGRINSFIVDELDATGNTVVCGGVSGGIWRCTNFLAAQPNWTPVNDFMSNLSISSLCQDPSNKNVMYAATGEPFFNQGAVRGTGVFKSIDRGLTWTLLSNTAYIQRSFKIECDASGNVYYATGEFGLLRSTNGGTSWTTITPTGTSNECTDFEISNTGRLHVSLGFFSSRVFHRYTDNPTTVTSSSWNSSFGLRNSTVTARRLEISCLGNILYGVTTNSAHNVDSCYKSTDGGATWVLANPFSAYPTGVTNTQGWVNLTLMINPTNTDEFIVGGLDGYRSYNSGESVGIFSYWVNSSPYVHADHHAMKWWYVGGQERILIAGDGGFFYSTNGGASFEDKNYNLRIKQFYSCAIHPTTSDYFLAGSQDNGSHQLKQPGMSYSTEVTGGDGCFSFIDQLNPEFQFTTFTGNNLRKSLDGGNTFVGHQLSANGSFVNPMDYDAVNKKLYANEGDKKFIRWNNPTTNATHNVTVFTMNNTFNGTPTAFTVSPYSVANNTTLFVGTNTGNLFKVTNADNVANSAAAEANTTEIGNGYLSFGTIKCIAIGTTENHITVTFTNYGISKVFTTTNGGTTWDIIDGNLPDMPVRWATYLPGNNNKLLLATEAGVFYNNTALGAATQWLPSPGFPLVRTDMFRIKANDNTIVAATYGRGLWTANLSQVLPLRDIQLSATSNKENMVNLEWKGIDATVNVKYIVQASSDGVKFYDIANTNLLKTTHQYNQPIMYYRVVGKEANGKAIFSNIIQVKSNKSIKQAFEINLNSNPIVNNGGFNITSTQNSSIAWQIFSINGAVVQQGRTSVLTNSTQQIRFNSAALSSGTYVLKVSNNNNFSVSKKFVKQ